MLAGQLRPLPRLQRSDDSPYLIHLLLPEAKTDDARRLIGPPSLLSDPRVEQREPLWDENGYLAEPLALRRIALHQSS